VLLMCLRHEKPIQSSKEKVAQVVAAGQERIQPDV
jgi:hypothetical protein